MNLNPTRSSTNQERIVDDTVHAYIESREYRTDVWDAYRRWTSAPVADRVLAHGAYAAALDREESAATAFATVMNMLGQLLEMGLDSPIEPPPAPEAEPV
jgi:hypothetical protein